MSLEYIRKHYHVNAYRWQRVRHICWSDGEVLEGTILGSRGAYLRVKIDGNKKTSLFHPTSVEYLLKPTEGVKL